MGVMLDVQSRDELRHKVALWKEEIRVHGDKTLLTQKDVVKLEARVTQLLMAVAALNVEYQCIVRL